jgi:hypothetical protein
VRDSVRVKGMLSHITIATIRVTSLFRVVCVVNMYKSNLISLASLKPPLVAIPTLRCKAYRRHMYTNVAPYNSRPGNKTTMVGKGYVSIVGQLSTAAQQYRRVR